jgi:hypothetical protein
VASEPGTILGLLEQAQADPNLLQALAESPLDTARAHGVEITPSELKVMLGIPAATDRELVEVLWTRVQHTLPRSCGGPCDDVPTKPWLP